MTSNEPPTLNYRPTPRAESPADAGPIGLALAAMFSCAVTGIVAVIWILALDFAWQRSRGQWTMLLVTTIATAAVALGGVWWFAIRLSRDPRSRPIARGFWLGIVVAMGIVGFVLVAIE